MSRLSVLLVLLFCLPAQLAAAAWDEGQLEGLKWREIGPYRGGRSAAVTGIPQDRETFYFGSTGGGVWKTTNGGGKWDNISDGFFGGSIGAVAVSSWDPNVIYVGTGEKTVRGNVSVGNGVWKSTDAGRTWSHTGLKDSQRIPRIRIHPKNPDVVYVAAMGSLFGPNEERGVFRSSDGGKNWQKILYINDEVGVVDLVMDPTNPRILYASSWRVIRTPYSLESGGEGSKLWKTTDGGDTWQSISENEGMPKPPLGISGISVSGSNPDNLYAIVEANDGGVFRSTDAGKTWKRVNKDRKLRQRAWYYTRIQADPVDEEMVYVMNVRFHQSKDGGKTFEPISTPHGDNHDLWIDPNDPKRMIEANDGGANVSYDGGKNWSVQSNQPTAQMYRVSTDNAFPYRLLGGQQDNSAIRIRSRSAFNDAIGTRDWEPTAGGESGHIIARPDNPDIVYGGSYGGFLIRYDHGNGDVRAINIWPDDPMGWGAAELKYRFNWNFPVMISPHDPDTLYAAANVLFKTTDEGQTWQAVSPDLTRNIKEKQGPSGGPVTKDNTSVEYYGTIFAVAESLIEEGVIWTGSDDGLLHISRDGGKSWNDVTPDGRNNGLPTEIQINSIEAHPFEAGGLYLAATGYKSDDFRPYLFRTTDYGKHWEKITDGIPADHFTRVIRADSGQRGLLFAGTEFGVYMSKDDGQSWQSTQLNLPVVPITDLAIKEGNLVAATQGRGYWILDNVEVLRQADESVFRQAQHLFTPAPTWRLRNGSDDEPESMGSNPPAGVPFYYWLAEEQAPDNDISLEIMDEKGGIIRTFTAKPADDEEEETPVMGDDDRKLETGAGLSLFVWDLRHASVERFKDLVLWNDSLEGAMAVPGSYQATLSLGDTQQTVSFEVQADPRLGTTAADYEAQYSFVAAINQKLTETHRAITRIREAKAQLSTIEERIGDDEQFAGLLESATELEDKLSSIEESLYQTKMESRQDPLNFPIRLNDKLAHVMLLAGIGDHAPSASAVAVRDELVTAVDAQLGQLEDVFRNDLAAFNLQAADAGLDAVQATADTTSQP